MHPGSWRAGTGGLTRKPVAGTWGPGLLAARRDSPGDAEQVIEPARASFSSSLKWKNRTRYRLPTDAGSSSKRKLSLLFRKMVFKKRYQNSVDRTTPAARSNLPQPCGGSADARVQGPRRAASVLTAKGPASRTLPSGPGPGQRLVPGGGGAGVPAPWAPHTESPKPAAPHGPPRHGRDGLTTSSHAPKQSFCLWP